MHFGYQALFAGLLAQTKINPY